MLLAPVVLLALPPLPAARAEDGFTETVLPFLQRHCVECHSGEDPAGELDLDRLRSREDARAARSTWRRVHAELRWDEMPPAFVEERPSEEERRAVQEWIRATFQEAPSDEGLAPTEPTAEDESPAHRGRAVTLRRLNRFEFENAVLDLCGVAIDAAELLPPDQIGLGFDVIGETLSMPPLLFERLFEAAEQVAAVALPPAGESGRPKQRILAADLEQRGGSRYDERHERVWMYAPSRVAIPFSTARAGTYALRVASAEQHAGPEHARLALTVDDRKHAEVRVEADLAKGLETLQTDEILVQLEPGKHTFAADFVNDYYRPEDPDPANRDRNVAVAWLELEGPLDAPLRTPFQERYLTAGRSAEQVLQELAPLFWRGSASARDVRGLLNLSAADDPLEERVRVALIALLASPRFLFRVEPAPGDGERRPLHGHELATRLSAYLWSSVPDAELLSLGDALQEPDTLAREVRRMLRDARASRLPRGFALAWLQLKRLEVSSPDPLLFPAFDADLREAMQRESTLFFEAVLREGRPISELLEADFTFANEALAKHYGLPGVRGDAMQRVPVPASLRGRRGGLLGQASVLTATSNPNRTSPVLRGKWVLEALLATPPPAPPPGVDSLEEDGSAVLAATLRERLEEHRANPKCATCHAPMDALGFALEPYDAVGAWRESDGRNPIDASAELPSGKRIDGPSDLVAHLLQDGRLLRGLLHHLATYALGRGLDARDRQELDALAVELGPDPALDEVIAGITRLDPFRHRYGGER